VKTRMQAGTVGQGTTALQTARGILRRGGALAFYRGVGSPLVALTVLNSVSFSTLRAAKDGLGIGPIRPGGMDLRVAVAGALVGPVTSVVSTPFELVKTQMQLPGVRYTNTPDAFWRIARTHGVHRLWTGFTVNMVRESTFMAAYFCCYEHMKAQFAGNGLLGQGVGIMCAGGLGGMLAWATSLPLDAIKANVMGQDLGGRLRGNIEVTKHILRERGIAGLYRGFGPTVARAFFVSGVRFSSYELAMQFLTDGLQR